MFVLDPDGFKKVTIKRIDWKGDWNSIQIVYLKRKHERTRLRTGILTDKDGMKVDGNHIHGDDVYGTIVNVEMLKPNKQV